MDAVSKKQAKGNKDSANTSDKILDKLIGKSDSEIKKKI